MKPRPATLLAPLLACIAVGCNGAGYSEADTRLRDGGSVHALVLADPQGDVVHLSDGAETLFGHRRGSVLGGPVDRIIPPDYREDHWAGFHAAMAAGESKLDGAAMSLPVLCADGAVRSFPAKFTLLTAARGETVGVLVTFSPREGSEEPFGPVLGVDGSDARP